MGTAQLISAGIGLIYSVITARGLGPALRGQFYVTQAYLLTANMLLSLSVATIMTVQVSRGDFEVAEVHTSAVLLSAALGVCGGLCALLIFLHTTSFQILSHWTLAIYFLSLPATLYKALWGGIVLGQGRIGTLSIFTVVDSLLTTAGAGVVLFVVRASVGGLLAMLAGEAAVMAAIAFLMIRNHGGRSWRLSLPCLRDLWRQGSQQQLATSIGQLYLRADAFILPHFISPAALGEYAIARGVADRITLAFTPFAQVMFPHISSKDASNARNYTQVTFRQLAGLGVLLSVAVLAVMPYFISIMYGRAYQDAVILADVLCIALIVRSITMPIELWFVGSLLRPKLTVITSTFMLVTVVVSGYLMTMRSAALGMASAVLLSFGLSLAFTIWVANRNGLGLHRLLPSMNDLRYAASEISGLLGHG